MSFKVAGVVSGEEPFVEVDDYVPLTVQWPGYSRLHDAPKCLMLDVGTSLIEVKLNGGTGEVVEIILVDAGRLEFVDIPLPRPGTIELGIPLLSFAESSGSHEMGRVSLHSDGLRICLEGGASGKAVGGDGVLFRISDQGSLLEVDVTLNSSSLARMRQLCR
ncbi:hypothetical protein [Streptomyces sp. NBC_01236]|uniref:hypothetical protein n=1 Tax=Streptomyces sp. NBC_01236 TaxID=2903789 RepID=UPI002E119C43|nr:hypothetical protein OG324_19790 [Streptomyces sp. NBC_01236]